MRGLKSFLPQGSCGTAASDSGLRPDVEFIRPLSLLFCTSLPQCAARDRTWTTALSTEHTQDGPRLMCTLSARPTPEHGGAGLIWDLNPDCSALSSALPMPVARPVLCRARLWSPCDPSLEAQRLSLLWSVCFGQSVIDLTTLSSLPEEPSASDPLAGCRLLTTALPPVLRRRS